MSTEPSFYEFVAQLHASLSDEQRSKIESFMDKHDALEFYREMVNPQQAAFDDMAQQDEYAITQALTVFQLVPEDEFEGLQKQLGDEVVAKFDEAAQLLRRRFEALGVL